MTKEARIHNGENTFSSMSSAGKTGQLHVRIRLQHFLTSYTKKKKNSKWIKGLNVRSQNIKFLENNTGRILFNKLEQFYFLSLSPKSK